MDREDLFDIFIFVFYHALIVAPFGYWYMEIFFRCIPGVTLRDSRLILWSLVIGCVIVGVLADFFDEPGVLPYIANSAAGFGIYMALSYQNLRKKAITIILILACFIALLYAGMILFRKIKSRRKRKRILKRRMLRAMVGVKNIMYIGMLCMLVFVGITPYTGKTLVNASVEPASKKSNAENWTIANHIEELAKLHDDTWKTLSVEEKLDVLQIVANIARTQLKIANELNVGAADLTGTVLGYYSDPVHEIVIRTDVLLEKSSYEAVHIICHEANHSLEYRLVDAYNAVNEDLKNLSIFDSAVSYKDEFANYKENEKNYFTYATMECEMDSEIYAEQASDEIYHAVYQYLGLPEQFRFSSCVIYDEQGDAYLLDHYGNRVAGPYDLIEDGETYYTLRRYRDENGLWGYLNSSGEEITPPMFVSCCIMRAGAALVRESADKVYFINRDGDRITRDYLDAEEFGVNSLTKVKTEDGRWSIINKDDVTLFSGLDVIGKINYGNCVISAMVSGHPALLALYPQEEGRVELRTVLDKYESISNVVDNRFAIITDAKDRKGVVTVWGNVIIEPKYISVNYEIISSGTQEKDVYCFLLEKPDGTYENYLYETK